MRTLVWIVEDTWEATVDEAGALVPADADITLMHVAGSEAEHVAEGARRGLLGRPRGPREALREVSDEASRALLADAEARLGRAAACRVCHGRAEREVVTAAAEMDLLVLARDGDHRRLGPRSLGPASRFVVDHAPCRVLLVWPDEAPSPATLPPHPPEH